MRNLIKFILAAILILAATTPADAGITYSPPFPNGNLGYARPPIGIRVIPNNGERVISASVTVDGATYRARQEGNLFVYLPEAPLAPGRHSAQVEVIFEGRWRPIRESWEFTIAPDALAELPPESLEQRLVLQAVNRYRAEADLPPLRLDPALNAAAMAHARYYVANPTQGLSAHTETPGRAGFTGTGPGERGTFFGYPYYKYYEDMHFLPDHLMAVRDWLDSVYHRFPLIDPGIGDLGYGYATDGFRHANVLNLGTTGGASQDQNGTGGTAAPNPVGMQEGTEAADPVKIIVYPIPGQRGVPLRWDGNEEPDPYRSFPGARPAGYPVTLQFDPIQVEASAVEYAVLSDENGNAVPIWLLTGDNDEHVAPNVALLPAVDLKPGTRYTARVLGSVRLTWGEVRRFDKRWWFTTDGLEERILPQTDIRITLDGRPLLPDVPPAWKNGRIMLPFRTLLENLGANVTWDPVRANVTAVLGKHRLVLKIGNDRAVVDGREERLDAAPFIEGERTLVPVRFVAESLGLSVHWNEKARSVSLTTSAGNPIEKPSSEQ